jgi:hypothetical protein
MNNPTLALPAPAETATSATSMMPNTFAICILGCFTLPLLLPTALVPFLRLQQVSTTDHPSLVRTNATELAASATLLILSALAVGTLSCYALPLMLLTCLVNPHKQGHASIASHPALASQRTAAIITSSTNSMTTNSISRYASNLSSLLPLPPLTPPSFKTSLFDNPMPLKPNPTPVQPHRSHDISRPSSPLPHPWRPLLHLLGFPSRLRGTDLDIERPSSMPACHDMRLLFGTFAPLALAAASIELHKPQGNQIDEAAATTIAATSAPMHTTQLQASRPRAKVKCTVGLATAGRWALAFGSWASPRSLLRACKNPFSALPRLGRSPSRPLPPHWCWQFHPLPRHWCSRSRSLGSSSLETASLTRQLQQQPCREVGLSPSFTSAPLSLSSTSAPLDLFVVSSTTTAAVELGSKTCYRIPGEVPTSWTCSRRALLPTAAKQGKLKLEKVLLLVHEC